LKNGAKKRAIEKSSPYFKKGYFLNAPFLLEVEYYKVKILPGGLGADKISIDETALSKIKQAFESFK
jgi:hypothetical protein